MRRKRKARDTDERTATPAGRRCRAPGDAPSGAEVVDDREGERFLSLLHLYAEVQLAPQKMAELRRRAGDSAASPRDYDCRCPVPAADALPDCWPHRHECRFRHRMRLRPKTHNNAFAHQLTREIFDDLLARMRRMPALECEAQVRAVLAFGREESRRTLRRQAEPSPEPAPLKENWKWSDVR